MLGISSKSTSRKWIIEFSYLFDIISPYFWGILLRSLVNSFVATSFLYSCNDSHHRDLGNISQNHFVYLSHDLPKLLHSVHILIYKLTFNKHSRIFIQIKNKYVRVGGLCVKGNLLCMEERRGQREAACQQHHFLLLWSLVTKILQNHTSPPVLFFKQNANLFFLSWLY